MSELPFGDIPETIWLWSAKITGAVFGSVISIAYLLPKGRREAAIRFLVGVLIGVIFGPLVGAEIANYFIIDSRITRIELVLMGSAAASLCAWWALGGIHRLASRYSARP